MACKFSLSMGCTDKYLSCLQHSKYFFCLDLEKGYIALFNGGSVWTSHNWPAPQQMKVPEGHANFAGQNLKST